MLGFDPLAVEPLSTLGSGSVESRPIITAFDPTGSDVPVDTPVSFTVVDVGVDGVDINSVTIRIDGNIVFTGGVAVDGYLVSYTGDAATGFSFEVLPPSGYWEYFDDIDVEVVASDLAAVPNTMDPFTWEFSTDVGVVESPVLTAFAIGARIRLSWEVPEEMRVNSYVLRRSAVSFPVSPDQGDLIYAGELQLFVDGNVVEGTEYFYTVFVIQREVDGVPEYVPYEEQASDSAIPRVIRSSSPAPQEYLPIRGEFIPACNPTKGAHVELEKKSSVVLKTKPGDPVLAPVVGNVRFFDVEGGQRVEITRGDLIFKMHPVRAIAASRGSVKLGSLVARAAGKSITMTIEKYPGRYIRPFYFFLDIETREGT